jgi:hypothetical protein
MKPADKFYAERGLEQDPYTETVSEVKSLIALLVVVVAIGMIAMAWWG